MTPSQLLARAFHDDPFTCWAEPEALRRHRTMGAVFSGLLAWSERHGGVLHEPGVGVVDWRDGAAAHLGPLAVARSGAWRVALVAPRGVCWRLAAHEHEALARVRPFLGPGAAYLCLLGVEPSCAGRGHGSRLLRRALAAQAARWERCVLRTEQPRNVPFYLRHGFTLVEESVVPVSGLRCWVFSRSLEDLARAARAPGHAA